MVYLYRPSWAVPAGGAGYSTFALNDGAGATSIDLGSAASAIRTFFEAVKAQIVTGTAITYPSEVRQVNEATGDTTGWQSLTAPGGTGATGATPFAAGVGARVDWLCGGVVNGRRVRGRTFLVPAPTVLYDGNGTIDETRRTTIASAAATLVSTLNALPCSFMVWSRPLYDENDVLERPGTLWQVMGSQVPDKVAWLRTRKD